MKEKPSTHKFKVRLKAKTLLQVFRETRQVNKREAYRRDHPNNAASSECNAAKEYNEEVMEEFAKMIRVDDKAISQLSNKRVIKELLEDINRINTWLESGDLNVDETVKLTAAKDGKLKMLGSFKGMWKGEQENKGAGESAEDIYGKLRGRFKTGSETEN